MLLVGLLICFVGALYVWWLVVDLLGSEVDLILFIVLWYLIDLGLIVVCLFGVLYVGCCEFCDFELSFLVGWCGVSFGLWF